MENLIEKINDADAVLVGIGREFAVTKDNSAQIEKAYERLATILNGKNYFIVSENVDEQLENCGFNDKRIINVAKNSDSEEDEKKWNIYNSWLMAVLKKNLLIVELGVGFQAPNMIRWPFERVTFIGNNTTLIRIHHIFPQSDEKIKEKSLGITCNSVEFINS